MRWLMISRACGWPMTRLPRCSCSASTVAISSLSILPTGMPVQAESTSPTICASTQTRIRPVSPCSAESSCFERLQLRPWFLRGVAAAFCAAPQCRSVDGEQRRPRPPRRSLCRRGRAPPLRACRAARGSSRPESRSFVPAILQSFAGWPSAFCFLLRKLGQRSPGDRRRRPLRVRGCVSALPVHRSVRVSVFDRRRSGVLAQRQARAGRVEDADRLVGQLPSGEIAMRELDASRRRPRRECARCDAFRARRPCRAS